MFRKEFFFLVRPLMQFLRLSGLKNCRGVISYLFYFKLVTYNGPAVVVVSVTRRQRQCNVSALAGSVSRRKEGTAQFLPVKVQIISPVLRRSCPPAAKIFC